VIENHSRRTLILFRAAIFFGAFSLFVVQPMYAKRLLPALGGSPAVWNTVMVFFQAALLTGYAYAHLMTRWRQRRWAARLHLALLAVAVMLPIMPLPTASPHGNFSSIVWLLNTLVWGIGPAFILVSASSPLIQGWFSRTDHPLRDDPYFLYAASNIGSFAALIAYPIVIEPFFPVAIQIVAWRIGLVVLGILLWSCSRQVVYDGTNTDQTSLAGQSNVAGLSWARRLRWIAYAAAASSWLLAVTQSLTTDLAPVPLLWVIPLGLYLLSFVVAFAHKKWISASIWHQCLPAATLVLVVSLIFHGGWQPIVIHLAAFVCGAMVCHSALAADRPDASQLTEFYLWISFGGVVGGIFNALISPLVFPVIVEYGIAIAMTAWAVQSPFAKPAKNNTILNLRSSWVLLPTIVLVIAGLAATCDFQGTPLMAVAVIVATPVLLAAWLLGMPRLVVAIGGLMLVLNQFEPPIAGTTRWVDRSFFGVHRVMSADVVQETRLLHGSTVHGIQSAVRPSEPLAYYARSGPLGEIFSRLSETQTDHVGVVGLGAGAIAAYSNLPSGGKRQITFYEIDPLVIRIATDTSYFSFLSDAGISADDIVLGDGRAELATRDSAPLDGLVLDAFSSDAIPMHLLTRESLAVYQSQLSEQGWVAFHISNRHLNLADILGGLAADANCVAYWRLSNPSQEERDQGIAVAQYVIMAADRSTLEPLVADGDWKPIHDPALPFWTDDYSNLLDVVGWR
jgi:hypothetical protein